MKPLTPTAAVQLESVDGFIRWLLDGWLGLDFKKALNVICKKRIADWTFCPLCQEIRCDDNCPLYVVRDTAGMWIGSIGGCGA